MEILFSAIISIDEAMKAVENNGYALRYVKDQTEAVCMKAVENNGDALRYVLSVELFVKLAATLKININKKSIPATHENS